jgi:heptosyltransferase-1
MTTPSRFLIVRLGALGDIIHGIPVAAALRRVFPSARIDWLVSARHRAILDLVPVIDQRLVINDRLDAGGGTPVLEAIRELRRASYDVALDLQGLLKSAVLARCSGAARVIGFSSHYLRERVARPFYTETYNPGADAASGRMHVVQMNLGLLTALGLTGRAPEFPIDAVDSPVARELLDRAGGRYALVNPGAAWPNKQWPPERFGAVAAALRARHGLTSIALWGPGEEALASGVAAASGGAAIVAPPTTIADVAALARGAALMISGDTGPTHIAAAVGAPIVGLYGPTRPSRNGPWSPQDITVSRDAICECHHLRRCVRDRMCMLDIGVDEVVEAVGRRLG